jgi:CRISPR-associated protein Cas2
MPKRQSRHYVIVYDVANNRKRACLANLLLDYGIRVQKSVFEAELSSKDVQEILQRAAKYVGSADSLRVYPHCKSCAEHIQALGCAVDTAVASLRIV